MTCDIFYNVTFSGNEKFMEKMHASLDLTHSMIGRVNHCFEEKKLILLYLHLKKVELHVVNGCVFVSMHCVSLHLGYCLF